MSLETLSLETIDAVRIVTLQSEWTDQWHAAATVDEMPAPWDSILQNHRMNFALWHEEDIARRDDLGAERVRDAKRAIDRFNQTRNNAVEQIDQWIHVSLPDVRADVPLHSETPGMIIDRLSILALKCYHMEEEACRQTATAVQQETCRVKAAILVRQRADLQECLRLLLGQLQRGERTFRLYKQFKMYNDPNLNPQLYHKAPP